MGCMGKESEFWGIIYDIIDVTNLLNISYIKRYEKLEKPFLDKSDILIF